MIDFAASHTHFYDHLIPVWRALPQEVRGRFYVSTVVMDHAARIDRGGLSLTSLPNHGRPIVVASIRDLKAATLGGRRAVYLNHGTGQTYTGDGGDHPSYPGGPARENIDLYLTPSPMVAKRNAARYPHAANVVVGCPKLDPWMESPKVPDDPPTVAISFHWPSRVCPEAGSAFAYFTGAVGEMAKRFPLIGHFHPSWGKEVSGLYERRGVPIVTNFAEVLDRADIYVCDNSSTIYEFAATGRPVVLMNSPTYRRDVEHGLRFWEWADVGLQADRGPELADVVADAITDPPAVRARREEISDLAYAVRDGSSSKRAAEAIVAWLVAREPSMGASEQAEVPRAVGV